jgi:membrane protease YdiL (CAAX protease family)
MNPELKSALIRIIPFVFILLGLFIANKRKKVTVEDLGLQKPTSAKQYFSWIIGFLVLAVLIEFCLYQQGILEIDKWNHTLYPSILLIFGAVFLAPISEELIFRGLILTKLTQRKVNIHLAILMQACFFVLLHNFTYQNTLSSNIGIAQSLMDACLFGYARQYTKSISTPITMHITGNCIATLERFIF